MLLGMMLRLDEHTGYLLRLAYDHAHRAAEAEFPEGPHPRIFGLLTALIGLGPLSQQQLADRLRINRTLVVGIVDDLERRGWVERRRDPIDRRSYQLRITDEGRRRRDALVPRIADLNERICERLDPAERERLNELLRRTIDRPVPPELEEGTGFLITQAYFLARDRANAAFRDLPIEIRHYGVMLTLDELGPASQQAVTNGMRISATMITQIVDDLERLGLVERARNPADRRSYTVSLTRAGRRVLAQARTIAEDFNAGDPELAALLRKLIGF
jgi:DNA-binding MarR family transcriptional regulator